MYDVFSQFPHSYFIEKKGTKQKLVTIFGVAHLLPSGRFVSNYLSSKISFVFVVNILPCINFYTNAYITHFAGQYVNLINSCMSFVWISASHVSLGHDSSRS